MSIRYEAFEVVLTTQEPFRIGALTDVMSAIDNPVATIGKRVVVQGSTLKGALRANLEGYLIEKYAPKDPAMKPCIPAAPNNLSDDEKVLIEKGLYKEGGGCKYSKRDKTQTICPICYLLGAQGVVGFVRVPYLYTDVSPEELYAVRVDRATGVVAEGANFDFQIIRDGVEFKGILEVLIKDTAKDWELGKERPMKTNPPEFFGDRWLASGEWNKERIIKELIVERLQDIKLLGGFKSKGCGKVKIEVK